MQPGFQSRIVFAATNQDGRNWTLTQPVVYQARDGRVFVIPKGASTDGASTPAIIAAKLPPTGDYWLASCLHDAAYRNVLLIRPNADSLTTYPADLSKDDCDLLLKEAMELTQVSPITATLIYEGVHMFGGWAYRADR